MAVVMDQWQYLRLIHLTDSRMIGRPVGCVALSLSVLWTCTLQVLRKCLSAEQDCYTHPLVVHFADTALPDGKYSQQ